MKGGSLNQFISECKKQDGGNLKRMLREVLKSCVQGGLTGLKSSRSFSDLKNKAMRGFQQGLKRKAKQVFGQEITKRARHFWSMNRPIRSISRRLRSEKGMVQRGGLIHSVFFIRTSNFGSEAERCY